MPFYQIAIILIVVAAFDWLVLRLWKQWKISGRLFVLPRLNKTWIFLAFSLIFIAGASAINDLDYPFIDNQAFSEFLKRVNDVVRLDVNHRENVLLAMLLLAGAAVLFARASRSIHWMDDAHKNDIPIIENSSRGLKPSRWVMIASAVALALFVVLLIRMVLLKNSLIDPFIWLAVIGLGGFLMANREKQSRGRIPAWNISRVDVAVILVFLAFGLLTASYRLASHPDMLMGDEGNFFETALGISRGDYRPSFFDLGVYSYPVAGSYWQGLVLSWFGVSLWSWRFASVLIGVLAVAPLYLLAKEMFGRRLALLTAACFVAAPYFLSFAHLGYNNSQVLLPVTLSAWLFYKGCKERSNFLIYLGGSAAGLGFYTYTAARISLVLGGVLLFAWLLRGMFIRSTRTELSGRLFLTLAFLLGWFLTAAPHLIFGSMVDPQAFRYKTVESSFMNVDAAAMYFDKDEIFGLSPGWTIDPYQMYFNPKIYLWLFQRGFLRTTLSFFLPGLISDHFLTSPLPGPVSTAFFLLGWAVCLARIRDRRTIFLLTWFFLVAILLSTLNTFPPRHTHMMPVIPVMAILTALGMDSLAAVIVEQWNGRVRNILRKALLTGFSLSVVLAGLNHYYVNIPRIFRPDIDQIMNWAELANPEYVPFYFITSRQEWEQWKPFVVGRVISDRPFKDVSEEDFLHNRVWMTASPEAVFFFQQEEFDRIAAKLKKDYQIDSLPLRLTDAQGRTIGGMLIKGSFQWPVKTSFLQEISILVKSPAGWIAGVSILIAFILVSPMLIHIRPGRKESSG